MEEKRGKNGDWGIVIKSVYRRDRDERVKQAYEWVLPDTLISRSVIQQGEEHGNDQHRALCQGI